MENEDLMGCIVRLFQPAKSTSPLAKCPSPHWRRLVSGVVIGVALRLYPFPQTPLQFGIMVLASFFFLIKMALASY